MISGCSLLSYTPCVTIMDVLSQKGGESRFIGGVVRDFLRQQPFEDIDIATNLTPDQVQEALIDAGVAHHNLAAEYGTITAHIKDCSFDITTLRRDLTCHGRQAQVAFTKSWQEDAKRRDFTINALSLDRKGNIYDYHGGSHDLRCGVVRFIGEPDCRIEEDYLRVLRFFRFHTLFQRSLIDSPDLQACVRHRQGLKNLSWERVMGEMKKIFLAPQPVNILMKMQDLGILRQIWKNEPNFSSLTSLIHLENNFQFKACWKRRIVALYGHAVLGKNAMFSKKDRQFIFQLAQMRNVNIAKDLFDHPQRIMDERGDAFAQDCALVAAAFYPQMSSKLSQCLELISLQKDHQLFPLGGEDIMKQGHQQGPQVGKILKILRQTWADSGFQMSKSQLLKVLTRIKI